jgi:hypothetical protein
MLQKPLQNGGNSNNGSNWDKGRQLQKHQWKGGNNSLFFGDPSIIMT